MSRHAEEDSADPLEPTSEFALPAAPRNRLLEPGRTTLSESAAERSPGAPAPSTTKSPIPGPPRKCCLCGVEDQVTNTGQLDEFGRPILQHAVTIELRYMKREQDLTPYLKSRGWRHKQHQGRHARERFVCRPCLVSHATMERDWEKKCADDKRSNRETFYQDLCN